MSKKLIQPSSEVVCIPAEEFAYPTQNPVREGDCSESQCCKRIYGTPRGADTEVRQCQRKPAYKFGFTNHYKCALHHASWIMRRK